MCNVSGCIYGYTRYTSDFPFVLQYMGILYIICVPENCHLLRIDARVRLLCRGNLSAFVLGIYDFSNTCIADEFQMRRDLLLRLGISELIRYIYIYIYIKYLVNDKMFTHTTY